MDRGSWGFSIFFQGFLMLARLSPFLNRIVHLFLRFLSNLEYKSNVQLLDHLSLKEKDGKYRKYVRLVNSFLFEGGLSITEIKWMIV
jgi:hypothetical protein